MKFQELSTLRGLVLTRESVLEPGNSMVISWGRVVNAALVLQLLEASLMAIVRRRALLVDLESFSRTRRASWFLTRAVMRAVWRSRCMNFCDRWTERSVPLSRL